MIKNNLILSIIFLILIGCAKEQKTDTIIYEEIVSKARLEYNIKEYKESLKNFEKAFNIIPFKEKRDYLIAAAAAFHIKDNEKATELIISSIKNLNVYENNLLSFKEFEPFMNNPFFTDIKYRFPSLPRIKEFVSKNLQIDKEIDSLIAEDQRVRKGSLERKPKSIIEFKEMKRVDSLNINRVIEITKEYGWHPDMFILLWHHREIHNNDNYVWNYFRPFINEQIKNGVIRKSFWAQYEDEKSMRENGTQIYGTYSGQSEQFPIEDIINIDIRRETMGLNPLWHAHLMSKIKLPKEYKMKTTNNHYRNNNENIKL